MKHCLKSEQVYQLICEKIVSGELKPGSRIPPEKDLAAQIGVGCCTLRKALARLEEQRLVVRLRKQGTFIAAKGENPDKVELPKMLVKPETQRNIHHKILVLHREGVTDSSADIMRHTMRYADEKKVEVAELPISFLSTGNINERLKWLKKQFFSGVIIAIHSIGIDSPLLRLPDVLRVPVVLPFGMDSDSTFEQFFVLSSMVRVAVFRSLYYLHRNGHRKIGILFRKMHSGKYPPHLHNVQTHELEFLYADNPPVTDQAEENQKSVCEAVDRLLKAEPELTAIFCYNDFMAAAALEHLKETGKKVPDDISVMGYSADPMGGMVDPPLTSVSLFMKERARIALDFILNGDYRKEVLHVQEPQIIERESVSNRNKSKKQQTEKVLQGGKRNET